MSTYSQWIKSKSDPARAYYVYGALDVLIEDVLDRLKINLKVPKNETFHLTGEDDLWSLAFDQFIDTDITRLIVVREAEEVKDWSLLHSWLINRRPNCYLVFVSKREDLPVILSKGKKVSNAHHIEILKTRGKIIKCSQPNDEDLLDITMSRLGLTRGVSSYLIDRVSGDVAEIFNLEGKIEAFEGAINKAALNVLCDEKATDSFVDYLVLRNKEAALIAMESLTDEEIDNLVSRLDRRLSLLYDIGRCVRKGMFTRDIVTELGVSAFTVKIFAPAVKMYDSNRILSCRKVLSLVDGELKARNRDAVLETLVALW